MDFQWLYDLYHVDSLEDDKYKLAELFRGYFSLEEFIDFCLTQSDNDFIHGIIQPSKLDNTLSDELEQKLCQYAEGMYIEVNDRLAEAIDSTVDETYSVQELLGFFTTTAVIGLSKENEDPKYPSFKDSYGLETRIKMWGDKVHNNPVLQTFVPFISGECAPTPSFKYGFF